MGLFTRKSKTVNPKVIKNTWKAINQCITMDDITFMSYVIRTGDALSREDRSKMANVLYDKSYDLFIQLRKEGKLL